MRNQDSIVGTTIYLWSGRSRVPGLANARYILKNVQIGSGAHQPAIRVPASLPGGKAAGT